MQRMVVWSMFGGAVALLCGFDINETPSPVESYEIARGARLYDSWYGEKGVDAPAKRHPAYPASGGYANKVASTWRCKECHGWDYLGRSGAYRAGSHFTGIKGTLAAADKSAVELEAILRNKTHRYDRVLDATDMKQLVLFLQKGQMDMDQVIDRDSRASRGKALAGAPLYQNLCATCHGMTGREKVDMPKMGALARKNPWETLHKTLYGHPGSDMPAYRDVGLNAALDILAYLQTLPE